MFRSPEELAQLMAAYSVSPLEQTRQIAYRFQLGTAWGIEPGQRILEIGCGQGDMTAVLAEMVGSSGHVVAVDSGPTDYGCPLTLGEATSHFARGPLGNRVTFHLNCRDFGKIPSSFDVVVFAHCAWYFRSMSDLTLTLGKARDKAPSLCLAEWSLTPRSPRQEAHGLAASMLSLASSFQPDSDRNIRKAFLPEELMIAVQDAGWKIIHRSGEARPEVDDGAWEVQAALQLVEEGLDGIPLDLHSWFRASTEQLRSAEGPYEALPSLILKAS